MASGAATSVVPANRARRGGGSALDDKLDFVTTEGIEPILSFDQMGIKDDLLRGIYGYGFEKPSAIQQRAVRPIIEGRDVIAQAQSGTGKTSMIALTVCQLVDTSTREYVSLFRTWILTYRTLILRNPNFSFSMTIVLKIFVIHSVRGDIFFFRIFGAHNLFIVWRLFCYVFGERI